MEEEQVMGNNDGDQVQPNDNLKLKLICEIGSTSLTLSEMSALFDGQVLEVGDLPLIVDLTLNGNIIASGTLVEVNGKLGVRLTYKQAIM